MHHGAQSAPYDIFNFTFEIQMKLGESKNTKISKISRQSQW